MRSRRADACDWPSTPVWIWRVFLVPVPAGRESASQCDVLLKFVLYGTLVVPGVSGCDLSAACIGAVVAEVFIPAFGQRLAEESTY